MLQLQERSHPLLTFFALEAVCRSVLSMRHGQDGGSHSGDSIHEDKHIVEPSLKRTKMSCSWILHITQTVVTTNSGGHPRLCTCEKLFWSLTKLLDKFGVGTHKHNQENPRQFIYLMNTEESQKYDHNRR